MSNRGVRGVRVVGPGSRRGSGRQADRPADASVENGSHAAPTGEIDELDDQAAADEAAAIQAVQAAGTGTAADTTEEHPEAATSGATPTGTATATARRWPLRLATTVAVLGLAGTIGFGVAWHNLDSQQGNVSAAKKQAQNYIIALTNFDPKGLDNEINKITSYATGNFKNSISQFFSQDVRNSLLSSNAASRGQVRAIYPQSNSGGHVTFFAVVDDTIANNKLSAPASDEIDMTVDMVNTSQGWRVANNTFLQSPLFSPTQPGGGTTPSTTPSPAPSP